MLSFLSSRTYLSEMMDSPEADAQELAGTFLQLSLINAVTLAYWPIGAQIGYFWNKDRAQRHWDILDLGSGNGDTLRYIDRLAQKRQRSVTLTGLDHCEAAISSARSSTDKDASIKFCHEDVLAPSGEYSADVIITSLLMHHLQDKDIIHLLRWMTQRAGKGWVICDLHRHPLPYVLIQVLTPLMGCNRMIRHDSRLSVARAFTRRDWIELLKKAQLDLTRTKIIWYPNFRYVIRYEKNI
jgi:SAM-dependent methyltransferase